MLETIPVVKAVTISHNRSTTSARERKISFRNPTERRYLSSNSSLPVPEYRAGKILLPVYLSSSSIRVMNLVETFSLYAVVSRVRHLLTNPCQAFPLEIELKKHPDHLRLGRDNCVTLFCPYIPREGLMRIGDGLLVQLVGLNVYITDHDRFSVGVFPLCVISGFNQLDAQPLKKP